MSVTVAAPQGAHFEFEKVSDKSDNEFDVPILVWDSLEDAIGFYGEEGTLRILDGTSLRVSFQNIARRFAQGNKSADDIAKAQVEFRPGTRRVGESTPVSRAARAARAAVTAAPENADAVADILNALAKPGTDLAAIKAALGIS